VHRIGRTARAGRSGKSLIYLMKNEDSYSSFLVKKQVKMQSFESYPEVPIDHSKLKEII
jgi:superfamily II DNA/RNA helicase